MERLIEHMWKLVLKKTSASDRVEHLELQAIIESISPASNIWNSAAATHAALPEYRPERKEVLSHCDLRASGRSSTNDRQTMSTWQWNSLALSLRRHPPIESSSSVGVNHNVYLAYLTGILIFASLEAKFVDIAPQIQLAILALVFAVIVAVFAIWLLFREARNDGRSFMQKFIYYTAAFLLSYELFILFSIFVGFSR